MRRALLPATLASSLATLLLVVSGTLPAAAQVVQGRLIDDETGKGVDGGAMTLLWGERVVDHTLSDSTGAFVLTAPESGTYAVGAERIGYRATRSRLLDLGMGDTLTVEFRVLTEAILLSPVLVTATSRLGRAQFLRRMEAGEGQFLTRDVLDTLELWHPAQAFRAVEDFYLTYRWGHTESGAAEMIPAIRSYRGSGCLGYVVDGVVAGPRFRSERGRNPWSLYPLAGLIESEIMAMEFYRYIGEVPQELRHLADRAASDRGIMSTCGLVMIWTRASW